MNSLVRVFSNFKEFYSEINGATLTGAIDVIVVEQPDGEFQCSPFHVRFGKLGVLRSREKVVDIEINGEPVDIHMKLGDSGEAFFVEECPEEDMEELPDNLATSPIPTNYFPNKFADKEDEALVDESGKAKTASDEIPLPLALPLPLPRRNSIDISKETAKEEIAPIFENQASDYSHRRYTDNTLERRNIGDKLKEYTTQKIRQEWAEHEEIFQFDAIDKEKDWINSTQTEEKQQQEKKKQEQEQQLRQGEQEVQQGEQQPQQEQEEQPSKAQDDAVVISAESQTPIYPVIDLTEPTPTSKDIVKDIYIGTPTSSLVTDQLTNNCPNGIRDESKGKKKRRKKSQMRKKNAQRKSSSSSSLGSNAPLDTNAAGGTINVNDEAADTISISNNTNSSNDESAVVVVDASMTNSTSAKSSSMLTVANVSEPSVIALTAGAIAGDESPISDCGAAGSTLPETPATGVTRIPDLDIHFFSDTEVTTSSGGNGPCGMVGRSGAGRPSTPIQSDSELEISMREKDADVELLSSSASWKWGELPTPELTGDSKSGGISGPAAQAQAQRNSMLSGMFNFMKKTTKIRHQVNDGGLYLSELDAENMDPEMAAMYFPISSDTTLTKAASKRSGSEMPGMLANANDDDRESGNGTSLPHSPSSMEGQKSIDSDYDDGKPQDPKCLDFVAMSLCGGTEKGDPTDEEFEQHLVKYSDVCENPSLFASPNLVVRLNGKFYNWVAACPIVMTIITFQKPLTNDAVEQLITNAKQEAAVVSKNEVDGNPPPGAVGPSKRSWWYWRRSQAQAVSNTNTVATNTSNNSKPDEKNEEKMPLTEADQVVVATQTSRPNSPEVSENTLSKTTDTTLNAENTSAMVENLEDLSLASSNKSDLNKNEHFKKSLRLSSEAIKKLNLKDGLNEIEFSVTTAYQGTTRCKCCLFRWKHNDKVVISDIDGTITKSDVLGHLLPMVGKDWAQLGVAQLFSKIEQNGYKLLYLSARAIGQSRVTREYLRSIRQGDVRLPDGPLLLNPTSLISAFHREVIERKPEQFKIACLSDIRDLFPDKQPFYAGYGNRINDVWAYRAVGIPIMRIFTINTKGELKHELTQTFQSSYCSMTFIVDQLFPPIRAIDEGSIEFSNFNYWRDPIPELDLELETSNSSISVVKASNNGTTNNNHNNSEPIIANLSKNATSSVNPNSILSKSLGTIPEN